MYFLDAYRRIALTHFDLEEKLPSILMEVPEGTSNPARGPLRDSIVSGPSQQIVAHSHRVFPIESMPYNNLRDLL
jgi:hypothetical protein